MGELLRERLCLEYIVWFFLLNLESQRLEILSNNRFLYLVESPVSKTRDLIKSYYYILESRVLKTQDSSKQISSF